MVDKIRAEAVEGGQRKAVLNAARIENVPAMDEALRALTPGQRVSIRALAIDSWAKELRGRLPKLIERIDAVDAEQQNTHVRAIVAATPEATEPAPTSTKSVEPKLEPRPQPTADRARTDGYADSSARTTAPTQPAATTPPAPSTAPGPARGTKAQPATQEGTRVAEGRL